MDAPASQAPGIKLLARSRCQAKESKEAHAAGSNNYTEGSTGVASMFSALAECMQPVQGRHI